MACQRCQLKIQKGMNVQRAGFVVGVELGVFSSLDFRIDYPFADQELGPFEIRIAIQQRVVEIKQGQGTLSHGHERTLVSSRAVRSSGSVIRRFCSRDSWSRRSTRRVRLDKS